MLTLVLANYRKYSSFLTCIVASKRSVGNAVCRNRAKRRVREIIRKHSQLLKPGDLLMVITKKTVCTARYTELEREFLYALNKVLCGEASDSSRH